MAGAGLDDLVVVLAIRVTGLGQVVFPVPQGADDEGLVHVAELEDQEDLVPDLRYEVAAPSAARVDRRQAAPVALKLVVEPGKSDLHAGLIVRVLIVGDHADVDAVEHLVIVDVAALGFQHSVTRDAETLIVAPPSYMIIPPMTVSAALE